MNADLIKKFWNPQIFGVDHATVRDDAYWPAEHGFQTVGCRPPRINFQSPTAVAVVVADVMKF